MILNDNNPSDKRIYPSRWECKKGKHLFSSVDNRSGEGKEELLTVSHITGITPRKMKNVSMFKAESLVGYKICEINDIAANTMWMWQGAIGVSKYRGVISPSYNVYRQKNDDFLSDYLDLLLREPNFTLQPQLLLAPVCYEDSWPVIIEKINLVARFIDVLIVSRVTNYRSVDYSTIKNFVFNVTKDIRMTDIPTLKQKLEQQYINLAFDPAAALSDLRLNSFTKKYIKNILARITGYIEEQTGVASNYCNYMNTQTKNPFEIEHIITDHYEWFTAEYSDQDDFRRWRNSIGALLLLHKSINASLNDAKYDYKLKKYCSNEGNIYTESLGELAYQNNPKFKKFIADNNLEFKAYTSFGKNEITERIAVLVDLVKLVWNDDMFI